MPTITRQVEGKIYHFKFDDLEGWTEEKDLRNVLGYWGPWGDLSGTSLDGGTYYSTAFSLLARIKHITNAGDMPSGRYLRRYRTVAIPSGLTSVRMQVRHRWTRNLYTWPLARKITLGDQTFLYQESTDAQNTWYLGNATVTTGAGDKILKVGVESYQNCGQYNGNVQDHFFDDLIICRSGSIKVTNLSTGYKAKLYDASDILIAQATESGGTATLDVSTKAYPITGRLKIYNASDVLEFTGVLRSDIYGGDEYFYGTPYTLSASVDNYIINQSGEAAPTSAVITFTLKSEVGNPIQGETISFSTTHGSVSSTSAITDQYGQASTTLTASSAGLAIVTGRWAGGGSYPPVIATAEISVHHATDSPDSTKEYDTWVQGKRMWDCLTLQVGLSPNENVASFETPDIEQWVKGLYDFTIYRFGTKLFFGRAEVLTKSVAPTPITRVQGRSMIRSLMRTPIASASYTNQTLKAIIESIHATYVAPTKQVLLGEIGGWLQEISATISITNTTAYDLLLMVANLGGAVLRVDADRKMHVK